MKKWGSALCAAACVLSLGTAAFADAGVVIKPVENEWNSVLWEEGDEPLARITFQADSDPDKFYSKLSTSWSDSAFSSLFADQDAYLFDFVGHPVIPAASLPTLVLYSPFVDEEGEPVPGKGITVYQVQQDNILKDVTSSFSAGYDGDGLPILGTRTRVLGTYILAEEKLEAGEGLATEPSAPKAEQATEPAPQKQAPANDGHTGIFLPAYADRG